MRLWRLSAEIVVISLTRWPFSSQPFACFTLCVCVCVRAHGTSKGSKRKRASAALLATRAGVHSQSEQLSYCEGSPHFPIHGASDRADHTLLCLLYLSPVSWALLWPHMCTRHPSPHPTYRYQACEHEISVRLACLNAWRIGLISAAMCNCLNHQLRQERFSLFCWWKKKTKKTTNVSIYMKNINNPFIRKPAVIHPILMWF